VLTAVTQHWVPALVKGLFLSNISCSDKVLLKSEILCPAQK